MADAWAGNYPEITALQAGVALSPDGRTLALVHADEDAMTLINTERMTVERTEFLDRPTGLGERLLGLLSFAPKDAVAKSPALGTYRQAYFAADGHHLYVTGYDQIKDGDGNVVRRGAGIRLIDTESGEIEREAMDGVVIHDLAPTLDGKRLYISVVDTPTDAYSSYWLRRLDPETLSVEAERHLVGTPSLLVRPIVPSGSGHHLT